MADPLNSVERAKANLLLAMDRLMRAQANRQKIDAELEAAYRGQEVAVREYQAVVIDGQ